MYRPLRKTAGWLLLIVVVAIISAAPGCNSTPTMSYADLKTEIEAGNVENVELHADKATVKLGENPATKAEANETYSVALPGGDEEREALTKLLADENVPFQVTEG